MTLRHSSAMTTPCTGRSPCEGRSHVMLNNAPSTTRRSCATATTCAHTGSRVLRVPTVALVDEPILLRDALVRSGNAFSRPDLQGSAGSWVLETPDADLTRHAAAWEAQALPAGATSAPYCIARPSPSIRREYQTFIDFHVPVQATGHRRFCWRERSAQGCWKQCRGAPCRYDAGPLLGQLRGEQSSEELLPPRRTLLSHHRGTIVIRPARSRAQAGPSSWGENMPRCNAVSCHRPARIQG